VRAAAEGAEALPPTPTGEKDKRGGFKDNGQMEGAISGEIAMEKVGAALVPSLLILSRFAHHTRARCRWRATRHSRVDRSTHRR
jgi:hypothetical protein